MTRTGSQSSKRRYTDASKRTIIKHSDCSVFACLSRIFLRLVSFSSLDMFAPLAKTYPGPRGFLLFFISKSLLIYIFFYWHEALRAEKRKPLVATVGNLTFMPSAFDRRFWLEDIFNYSMSHMIGWIKYLWGWEWSVYVHLYGYVWRTFALSTDSLTREG